MHDNINKPEEMVIDTVEVGDPGPGQVRIRHHAIGLNFIDVYQRTGLYNNPLPLALGLGAACLLSVLLLPVCIRLFRAKPGPVVSESAEAEGWLPRSLGDR